MSRARAAPGALACGVDEAGRGPLAGPVYAAAVILDPGRPIIGVADCKTLSAKRREQLADEIRTHAVAWAVASASVEEIDHINILQATMLAMRRAVERLGVTPVEALVDEPLPNVGGSIARHRGGDASVPAISAASILAKTERDAFMLALHEEWPHYRFDRHKGYGTEEHLALLRYHGACPAHRRSFAPVRAVLHGDANGPAPAAPA